MNEKNARIELSRRAQRDIDDIPDAEFEIIKDDIRRIAAGTFPGEIKMIHALPGKPLQADSGRYRVLCRRSPGLLEIISVFPKKQQSKVFRSLR
jgi:hypothetical protein